MREDKNPFQSRRFRILGIDNQKVIRYIFGGHASIAIVALFLICIFLANEVFGFWGNRGGKNYGFFSQNHEELTEYRLTGQEFVDFIRDERDAHSDIQSAVGQAIAAEREPMLQVLAEKLRLLNAFKGLAEKVGEPELRKLKAAMEQEKAAQTSVDLLTSSLEKAIEAQVEAEAEKVEDETEPAPAADPDPAEEIARLEAELAAANQVLAEVQQKVADRRADLRTVAEQAVEEIPRKRTEFGDFRTKFVDEETFRELGRITVDVQPGLPRPEGWQAIQDENSAAFKATQEQLADALALQKEITSAAKPLTEIYKDLRDVGGENRSLVSSWSARMDNSRRLSGLLEEGEEKLEELAVEYARYDDKQQSLGEAAIADIMALKEDALVSVEAHLAAIDGLDADWDWTQVVEYSLAEVKVSLKSLKSQLTDIDPPNLAKYLLRPVEFLPDYEREHGRVLKLGSNAVLGGLPGDDFESMMLKLEAVPTRFLEIRDSYRLMAPVVTAGNIQFEEERQEAIAEELAALNLDELDFDALNQPFYDSVSEHETVVQQLREDLDRLMAQLPTGATAKGKRKFAEAHQYHAALGLALDQAGKEIAEWRHDAEYSMSRSVGRFFVSADWITNSTWRDFYGILPLLVGSLIIAIIALVVAVPFSVAAAIYVNQVASQKEQDIIKPVIEFIGAIPSIVLGFFGILVLGEALREFSQIEALSWIPGFPMSERLNMLTAGLLLGFMATPTIFTLAEDAINNVPRAYSQASLAVGASRMQTVLRVIVPAARSGIGAAVLLGFGRIIGETMVVLLVAGNKINLPDTTESPGSMGILLFVSIVVLVAVLVLRHRRPAELSGTPTPVLNVIQWISVGAIVVSAVAVSLPVAIQPTHTMTGIIAQELGEVQRKSLHWAALFAVGLILFTKSLIINIAAQKIVGKKTA